MTDKSLLHLSRWAVALLLALTFAVLPVVEDGCDPGGPTWPDVTGALDR